MTLANLNRAIAGIISKASNIKLRFLALMYILAYVYVEIYYPGAVRSYMFTVLLAISGIYFSWFMGGKHTMGYVAFFNIFIVFIFSKMLWSQNIVVTGQVFLARSFILMYVLTVIFIFFILLVTSPADRRQVKQKEAIEKERIQRQNLEFMVASRKIQEDLLAQANRVKDELQLLEGAWRSNIHNIINDLPSVKERELYEQILLPFQDNIIRHLRELELRLTFDVVHVSLSDLYGFIREKISSTEATKYGVDIEIVEQGWEKSGSKVYIDQNKIWDILHNLFRNSQSALDLKKIDMLRKHKSWSFEPRIRIVLSLQDKHADIRVIDNGGGAPEEHVDVLFKSPVPSRKRGFKKPGQGTLFVKFFAERMDIEVTAGNVTELDEKGLAVLMRIPVEAKPSF